MKPLRLILGAFGPYPEEEVIDFTRLGEHRIFLVTGPTGAGKTTIFDGIAYAIYGEASGQERDGESLRSQFADLRSLTRVELEFELRGTNYHIKRIPRQEKAKSRGAGTTLQNPEAELIIGKGPEARVISGINPVKEKIQEIMGISCEQFRQIMMLPQGEFRRLLTSDSREREKILQRIFGTEKYKELERRLTEKAKAMKGEIQYLLMKRHDQIKQIQYEPGSELAVLAEARDINIHGLLDELERTIQQDEERIKEFSLKIQEHDSTLKTLQREMIQGEVNNKRLKERDQLTIMIEQHQEKEPYIKEQEKILQAGQRAAMIIPIEENYLQRQAEINKRKAQHEAILHRRKKAQEQLDGALNHYQAEREKEPVLEKINQELTRLKGFLEKVERLSSLEDSCIQLDKSLKEAEEGLEGNRKALKSQREEEMKIVEQVEGLQADLVKHAELIGRLEKAQELCLRLKQLDNDNSLLNDYAIQYKRLKCDYEKLQNKYHESKKQQDELHEAWYLGQAGLLADTLKAGSPCPVCGSTHHPHPAESATGVPTEIQLREVKEQIQELELQLRKKQNEFMNLEADGIAQKKLVKKEKEELSRVLSVDIDELKQAQMREWINKQLNMADHEREILEREALRIKQQKARQAPSEARLKQIRDGIRALEKALEEQQTHYTALLGQVQSQRALIAALKQEIPETIRSKKSLDQAISDYEATYLAGTRALKEAEEKYQNARLIMEKEGALLKESQSNLEEASRQERLSLEKLQQAIAQGGFENISHYQEAKLPQEKQGALEEGVRNFYETLKSLEDRYQEAVLATAGIKIIDLGALIQQEQQIKEQRSRILQAETALRGRVEKNIAVLKGVVGDTEEIAQREETYRTLGHLAEVARGNNKEGMTFERYVLAAFLDQIVQAANERLLKMTDRRYSLARTDERARSNAQGGLELEVFDYYTGKARHVKTLSGGEGFKASLALALGLADVVQSYAGGISLDTIFIDEGFGTLDPESLDNAIEALMELRQQGRLVGIISHVPELKERIEAKLEIIPGHRGSKTLFKIG